MIRTYRLLVLTLTGLIVPPVAATAAARAEEEDGVQTVDHAYREAAEDDRSLERHLAFAAISDMWESPYDNAEGHDDSSRDVPLVLSRRAKRAYLSLRSQACSSRLGTGVVSAVLRRGSGTMGGGRLQDITGRRTVESGSGRGLGAAARSTLTS